MELFRLRLTVLDRDVVDEVLGLLELLEGRGEGVEGVGRGLTDRLDDEEVDRRKRADGDEAADQLERDVAEEVDRRSLDAPGVG